MSKSKLPERPSIDYLKKIAKERLRELRKHDPRARLAEAQLAVAREHDFPSWRALKAEIDRLNLTDAEGFFDACAKGNIATLRALVEKNPALVRSADKQGWTGLHTAAKRGRVEIVQFLLAHGADPNAREPGDDTSPLHWAAAQGNLEIVRSLLDAGADVNGFGDDHALDVIGWATVFGSGNEHWRDVVSLLLSRGARHHIFSAIATGDLNLIRDLVRRDPTSLERRGSRNEEGRTALQYAMSLDRHDILDLLIELGADVKAKDSNGKTALAVAMLRGNQQARRLYEAGAEEPAGWKIRKNRKKKTPPKASFAELMADMAGAIEKAAPMLRVPDVRRTLAWYTSIGFKELTRYEHEGVTNFCHSVVRAR
jgi:ankyrin repeat protein